MDQIQNTAIPLPQYEKIGGWLSWVAIGLFGVPLRTLGSIFRDLVPVFSGNTWGILTTQGTSSYHPLWGPLIIYELAGSCIFVVFPIIIAFFFFQKKKIVPRLMISYLLLNILFVIVDYCFSQLIPAVVAQNNPMSLIGMIVSLVAGSIWISYFLVSKRVKGTFIH